MAARWLVDQFRAAMVSANATLIFLGLLTESYATEGEILEQFYRRFGSTPSAKELRSMVKALAGWGFVEVETVARSRSLRITRAGLLLLEALRADNRNLVGVLVD